MIYPIANPTENQMIALANELYQLSGGMCQAGVGPYGIGVHGYPFPYRPVLVY